MIDLKKQFITSICNNLKIEADPFTVTAISKLVVYVDENQYSDFLIALFSQNSDYKKPMQLISQTAEQFKTKKEALLFDDVEAKAKELISRVNRIFNDMERSLYKQNHCVNAETIKSLGLDFGNFLRADTKEKIFSNQEIKILHELGDFEYWLHVFQNADIYRLETQLIMKMKNDRARFYLSKKGVTTIEDKTDDKVLNLLKGGNHE